MAEVHLDEAPAGAAKFYDKGVAAMQRDNLDYAMDMFESALHIEPRLHQVRKLLRAAAVRKAKAHPPGKLAAARSMGNLLKISSWMKKSPFQALEAAEKLIRIDPFNLTFAKSLCSAAEAAGLPEAAILTLDAIKTNQAPNTAVLEPLARLYRETEQFDLEYECCNALVKLNPNNSAAVKELKDAAARLTMGKAGWQKAETYRDVMREEAPAQAPDQEALLQQKIGQEPENVNYRRTLADLQLASGRHDEAIRTLETCLELSDGSDPQVELKLLTAKEQRLGFALAEAEDAQNPAEVSRLRKELADMRTANARRQVERYPNDLQLKFEYGKLLFDNGQHTEAIAQLQLAQRNPQRRTRSLIYLAQAFKAKGQTAIALDQLESALSDLPTMNATRKEVLYELGSLHEAAGNTEKAASCFSAIYAVDIGYRNVASKVEQD